MIRKQRSSQELSSYNKLLNKGFLISFIIIGFISLGLCYLMYQDKRAQAISTYKKRTQKISAGLSQFLKDYFIKLENNQNHWISEHNFQNISDLDHEEVRHIYALLKNNHVTAISIISPEMKLAYTYPQTENIGADLSSQEHNQKIVKLKVPIISSPFQAVQGYNTISIATPIQNGDIYICSLSYLVDFDSLISSYLKILEDVHYENIFIFDQNDSLIYNNKTTKNIPWKDSDNYIYKKTTENKLFGTEIIDVKKDNGLLEKQLIAFSTININERNKWYIFLKAPLKQVVTGETNDFTNAYLFPLSLFILLLIILNIFRWFFAGRYSSMLENSLALDKDSLKQAEFRLSTILNALPYIIFETDKNGKLTFLRAALNKIEGINPEEFYGKKISDFICDESTDSFNRAFKYLINNGKHLNSLRINMIFNPSESVKVYSISAFPKLGKKDNITGVNGILHDISERVELEGNLIQSQKMEVIGSVTSSVAHDFNNYLATMLGYVGLMKMKGNNDEDLDLLENAIQKASTLTDELLTFSRKSENIVGSSNLNKCILENIVMIKKTLSNDIKVTTNLDENIPLGQIHKSKLDQIFLNLLVNANDAMPDGGEIYIETWSTDLNAVYAPMMNLVPGEYIAVKVSDTGVGLTENAKNRIFEPYFTTKKDGTGLGMATVYSILTNAGGTITVRSKIGEGAEFVIYIPIALNQNPEEELKTEQELHCLNLKNQTILLVEDEKFLADAIAKSLQNFTKKIICKENGEAGLETFKSMEKDIGLIISDITMEKMDGLTMVQKIRELKYGKTVPVLFISGKISNQKTSNQIAELNAGFLKKPFSITTLINELNLCK